MMGGSKAVWNFSKKSSNFVAPPFPYGRSFHFFAWYCSAEKAIKSLIYCMIDLHGSPLLTTLVTHHWSRLYYSVQCSGHNELETKIFPRFASEIGNGDVLKACMPSCQVALLGKQLAAWSAVVNRLHKGSAVED